MEEDKSKESLQAEETVNDGSPLQEKKKETSGEYLWRVLKPAGCVLVLILFVLYFVVCFCVKAPAA